MQSDTTDHDQLTFRDLGEPKKSIERMPNRGITVIEAGASPNQGTKQHSRAVLKLRWLLQDYLRTHDIGHEFQAIDFSHWARQRPQFDQTIEMRKTGGMFLALVRAGIIEKIGVKNNGGDKQTNYHGTTRYEYRIVMIDFSRLGWLESLAGIEQDGVWDDSSPPRPKRVAS